MGKDGFQSFSGLKKRRIAFSIVFTFLLPICTLLSSNLTVIFNLIFFPFTLIHELGHLFVINLFLPSLNPQLEFHLLNGEFCCACIIMDEFPLCWPSIIAMFAGSFSVIIFVMLCIFTSFRIKSKMVHDIGKYYLFFGLLADLPNLLPIRPTSLGFVTDGFGITTCLCQMGYSFFLSNKLSDILSLIAILMVLASFFFLGSFLYTIGEAIIIKFGKDDLDQSI